MFGGNFQRQRKHHWCSMILALRLFAVMLARGAPAYVKLYFKVELIQVQLCRFMLKHCVSGSFPQRPKDQWMGSASFYFILLGVSFKQNESMWVVSYICIMFSCSQSNFYHLWYKGKVPVFCTVSNFAHDSSNLQDLTHKINETSSFIRIPFLYHDREFFIIHKIKGKICIWDQD